MRTALSIIAFFAFFIIIKTPVYAVITFSISNPQYNGDEITIDVSLSGLTSASCPNNDNCYLQAALTQSLDNPRYFGFTKNHQAQWYEYVGSPNPSYIQTTFFAFPRGEGSWAGQITLKPNSNDPDYKGPGDYYVKVWRYTGNSSNYAGDPSNTLLVIIAGPTSTPTPTPTPTSSPTNTPTPTKTPTPTPTKTSTGRTSQSSTPTPTPIKKSQTTPKIEKSPSAGPLRSEASEAGLVLAENIATETPTPTIVVTAGFMETNLAKFLIVLGGLFLASCGVVWAKWRKEIS